MFGNSQINSIPELTVFFHNFSRTKAKAYAFNLTVRADHIHSQSEIVFDPEKLTCSISSGHTTTCKRPGSYSLPYSMPSPWKISPNSPFWSGNVTTSTREPFTCAWIRADIWRLDGAICSKNRKIVPYHRCARILRLTVSIPDYGSCWRLIFRNDVYHTNLKQKFDCKFL